METSVEPTPSVVPGQHLLQSRARTAKRWLVPVSIALHVGAIGTYVVLGMWKVERLSVDRAPVEVVVGTMVMDPGGGDGQKAGRKPPPVKPPPEKQQVRDRVQPVKRHEVAAEQTPATTPGLEPGEKDGGKGLGTDPTKPPGDGDPCVGPDCKEGPGQPPGGGGGTKPAPKVDFVPPKTIEALRTRGQTQIHPSEVTKTTMLHEGSTKVTASVMFCIDARGSVEKVRLTRSSGYAEYDAKLVNGVRGWGYRPYVVGGTPVPVCTAVVFNYVMK